MDSIKRCWNTRQSRQPEFEISSFFVNNFKSAAWDIISWWFKKGSNKSLFDSSARLFSNLFVDSDQAILLIWPSSTYFHLVEPNPTPFNTTDMDSYSMLIVKQLKFQQSSAIIKNSSFVTKMYTAESIPDSKWYGRRSLTN